MNVLRAGDTGDITLEPQTAAHAAEMFEVLGDPALYEYEGEPPPSLAWLEHRFFLLESRASPDGHEQWLNWIVRLPTGEAAGCVQATVMTGQGWSLVAYQIASRHWRRGIGRAAVGAVLDELARTYAVVDAVAVLKASNARSHAFLVASGFVEAPTWVERSNAGADERVMHRDLTRPTRPQAP